MAGDTEILLVEEDNVLALATKVNAILEEDNYYVVGVTQGHQKLIALLVKA